MISVVLFCLMVSLQGCAQKPVKPSGFDKAEASRRHVVAAKAYIEEGNTRKALKHLKNAEEFDKKSVDLFLTYAQLYRIEEDPKREEYYYKKALSVERNNSRAKNNYGSFLCFHDEAKAGLKLLIDASEDYYYHGRAEAYVNRGLCENVLQDTQAAEKSFQQAIRLNTRTPRPYLELSEIYFARNDLNLASMYHKQYLDNQNQQDARALLLGVKIAKQQNNLNAMSSYGLLLEKLYPTSSEYQEYLRLSK